MFILYFFISSTLAFSFEERLQNAGHDYDLVPTKENRPDETWPYVIRNCIKPPNWTYDYLKPILKKHRPASQVLVIDKAWSFGVEMSRHSYTGIDWFFDTKKPVLSTVILPIPFKDIPELMDDFNKIETPEWEEKDHKSDLLLWMNNEVGTGDHRDSNGGNLLMQVTGENDVLMHLEKHKKIMKQFLSKDLSFLLGDDQLDKTKREHSTWWGIKSIVARLRPGDCLWIPDNVSHNFYHVGFTVGIGRWVNESGSYIKSINKHAGLVQNDSIYTAWKKRLSAWREKYTIVAIEASLNHSYVDADSVIENDMLEPIFDTLGGNTTLRIHQKSALNVVEILYENTKKDENRKALNFMLDNINNYL